MNKSPARRPFRPLLAVPLAALLVLGGALAVTGGGFGGSSPSSSSSSSSSSSFSSSSIWGPSSSSSSGTSSSSDSEWTLGEVLFVMGLFVAFAVVSSLIDWVKARRRSPQAVQVQLLLTDGAKVKAGLRNLAELHDPDRPGALPTLLRESALLLLRRRGDWTHGTLERRRAGDPSKAAQIVGAWAARARAAFETQTTSQYQNGDATTGLVRDREDRGRRGGTFLAVTLAASTVGGTLPDAGGGDAGDVEAAHRPLEDRSVDRALDQQGSKGATGLHRANQRLVAAPVARLVRRGESWRCGSRSRRETRAVQASEGRASGRSGTAGAVVHFVRARPAFFL